MNTDLSKRELIAGTALVGISSVHGQKLDGDRSRPARAGAPSNVQAEAFGEALLTAPYEGAAPVYIKDLLSIWLPVRKFGARGDATDQTDKLNRMFEAAYADSKMPLFERGSYGVRQGGVASDGTPYCLLNKGTSMRGVDAGNDSVMIFPMAGTPANADILRVEERSNSEFLEIADLMVAPDAAAGIRPRGGIGLRLVGRPGANCSLFKISRCYITPGNNYSVLTQNLPAEGNQQGQPSNALFAECYFGGGFKGVGLGDSNLWFKCVFRSNSPDRNCLDLTMTNYNPNWPNGIANLSSVQHILDCNFGGLGSCIVLHNGRHIVIENPNAELGNQPGSTGGVNRTLLDVSGDVGGIVEVKINGGQLAVFGDSSAESLVRLGNVQGVEIGGGVTLAAGKVSGRLAKGIDITAGASEVVLDRYGVNDPNSFGQIIHDRGVGTRGIEKTLALTPEYRSLQSGFELAGFIKDRSGRVHLCGEIVPPQNSVTSAVIGILPPDFRPANTQTFGVCACSGSRTEMIPLQILSTGEVVYKGRNSNVPQFTLSGISFLAAGGGRYYERAQPS